MSWYTMRLIREKWVEPWIDTMQWENFDLSCKNRDETGDQVLHDAVASGAKIGAIFKEPTITPTADQVKEMGLSRACAARAVHLSRPSCSDVSINTTSPRSHTGLAGQLPPPPDTTLQGTSGDRHSLHS